MPRPHDRTRIRRTNFDPLADTVAAAAVGMAAGALVAGKTLDELREKDLQQVVEASAPTMYATYGDDVTAKSEAVRWPEFPDVGRVDVAIRGRQSYPIYVELKWCYAPNKLTEAVWDLIKLSIPLSQSKAAGSVLLYGAPCTTWNRALGSELFNEREWHITDHRRRYATWWRYWQDAVKTRPKCVPDVIKTDVVLHASIPIRGRDPWELRAVEVPDTTDAAFLWTDV